MSQNFLNRRATPSAASHEVVLTSRQRDNHPYNYSQTIKIKKHKVNAPALYNESFQIPCENAGVDSRPDYPGKHFF